MAEICAALLWIAGMALAVISEPYADLRPLGRLSVPLWPLGVVVVLLASTSVPDQEGDA